MLRMIQRCFSWLRPQAPNEPVAETTVLLVRIPMHAAERKPAGVAASPANQPATGEESVVVPRAAVPTGVLTRRSDAATEACDVALRDLAIFSPQLLRRLRRAGVCSAADLLATGPEHLVQRLGAPAHWRGKFRRYQRAIRFSRHFSEMTPHEALLLFAVHRRSRSRLAAESPGVLRRDLERLLVSSRGHRLAAGRPAPDIARVRLWIRQASGA